MPPSAPKPPQQPPKVTAVVVIREQLGGTGAAWAYSGDRERAEGIHLRGLVADLHFRASLCIHFKRLVAHLTECKFTSEGWTPIHQIANPPI